MFALVSYGTAVSQLAPLIVITLAMLILIGIAMWIVDQRLPGSQTRDRSPRSSVCVTAFTGPSSP